METIKKFGLKYHDLPTMLENVTYFLSSLALNIDPRHTDSPGFLFWVWLVFTVGCYFYVYIVSMVWFVFWRCRETGDVFLAIIVFSLGVASMNGPTKLLYLLFHRNKLRKMIKSYLECDAQVVPGARFSANLKPTLRAVKKRAMVVWNVLMWNGFIYMISPLFVASRQMPEEEFLFYGVEDMSAYPVFEIVYAANSIAVFFTCYPSANITAFFTILVGYIKAQMLALSEELNHLYSDAVAECNKIILNTDDASQEHSYMQEHEEKLVNEYINTKLNDIVKQHIITINLMKEMEAVFRGAVAIEFILLIIGLISKLLGGLEKTFIQIPFTMMFVITDCLYGQRMIDAGGAFEIAVYNCQWENFNINNRKTVLLMLQMSQKTMRLSAGGITDLSYETLMNVIKTVYSAFTTLRSIME